MSTPPVDRRTLAAIAPKLAELTETVLFGDIWARSELSPRERSLITLSALTAQGKTEQLPWHIAFGYQNGLSREEMSNCLPIWRSMPVGRRRPAP